MPIVRPFAGLWYDPARAGPLELLTTPPYDAITPADQQRYYRAGPHNVVRLILGRREPGDDGSANQYTRASAYLRSWIGAGVLVSTGPPRVYPYEMAFRLDGADRVVRGVVAEVSLEPWGGSIVPHERTFAPVIRDRLRLLRAVQTNLSMPYLVHRRPAPAVTAFLDGSTGAPPAREVVDEAGTRHRLWASDEGGTVVAEGLRDTELLIADGHHRYAVALEYREEMRAAHGPGPWDAMMMLLVDATAERPPLLPLHRVIAGHAPAPAGKRVRDLGEILASIRDDPPSYGTVARDDGALAYRVASLDAPPPTVEALHRTVLGRTPLEAIRFVPDAALAASMVADGSAAAAYLLPPTTVDRIWEVVAAGRRLPPKSTSFWPKPRTGMLLRPLTPRLRTPASSPPSRRPR